MVPLLSTPCLALKCGAVREERTLPEGEARKVSVPGRNRMPIDDDRPNMTGKKIGDPDPPICQLVAPFAGKKGRRRLDGDKKRRRRRE